MSYAHLAGFAVAVALSSLIGCGGQRGTSSCVPGTSIACSCTDGRMGAQECNGDGEYNACACSAPPMDDTHPAPAKVVFVTKTAYDGNLVAAGGERTGERAADAAGRQGTFRAWISDSRANAVDRINGEGPWLSLKGVAVFRNRANLMTQPVSAMTDEDGRVVTSSKVWTGTKTGGLQVPCTDSYCNCVDWTASSNGPARAGHIDDLVFSSWTESTWEYCSVRASLVCFEQ